MADATFIFRLSGSRDEISSMTLDVSISENHTQQAQVTEHPVEFGADITDHVRPKPREISVQGFVTNTTTLGANSTDDGFLENRVHDLVANLDDLLNNGTPCKILTSLRTYDNMVLKSLQIPQDAKTSAAVEFTATFQEIFTVATRSIEVPKPRESKNNGKTKTGKQPGKTAPPQVERALDAKIEDFGKSLFK